MFQVDDYNEKQNFFYKNDWSKIKEIIISFMEQLGSDCRK